MMAASAFINLPAFASISAPSEGFYVFALL